MILPFVRSVCLHSARLVLPWVCAHCRRVLDCLSDDGYCAQCWLELPRIQGLVCWSCGLPLPLGGHLCHECERTPKPFLIRAAALYGGGIRTGIHRFKYFGRTGMERPFVTLLAQAWRQFPELHTQTILAPVPLHPRKLKHRGFNQAALLAEKLGKKISCPVVQDLFWRRVDTLPQHTQNSTDRRENLQSTIIVNSRYKSFGMLRQVRLLLVDDVATTGATIDACYQAFKAGGGKSLAALVLARDPLLHSRPVS